MTGLFNTRLKRHLKEMFKYLRLVFNDHFVFALLIMLGGLGLAYSNALKTLPRLLGGERQLSSLF
ncbi:ABC transporter permease [Secundilactobacillus kimchicus]|uniref:ABC transporter permease n=1 Tax=Secundilactobacillus kimchicus TaxID=528209 RepID=UPI000B0AAEF4|nr:ABC transporter permease [Secundilactobacillus kimchicus]